MKYVITHNTAYKYSEPASLSQNELFLMPRKTASQEVIDTQINISPEPQYLQERKDFFGNVSHVFMVQHPHKELSITAKSRVETHMPEVPQANATLPWEETANRLKIHATAFELDAYQYVFKSPLISIPQGIREYAAISFLPGTPVLTGAIDFIHRIFTEFKYDKAATTVDTPIDQVLKNKKGVCQDFAHIAISGFRSLGLAARYVSGYLETLPPPGKPKLIGADASHAWVSVFVPDFGWIDLDPTNDLITSEKHITLAWGRDYGDVTPVKGVVMGGGNHTLSVMVDVAQRQAF